MFALRPRPAGAVTTLGLLTLFLASGQCHAQITFTNNSGITIPLQGPPIGSGTANPFPSTITVSGYTGTITNITVTLTGFSHTYTDDLGAIFTGPGGQKSILFDGPGLDFPADPGTVVSNINLTFSDSAAAPLPDNANFGSGTYRPGQNQHADVFSAPAPAGPYATNFSALIGTAPDGVYALYVEDFLDLDGGSITSWSITLSGISPVPEPGCVLGACAAVTFVGGLVVRRRRRAGASAAAQSTG